ncbi:hypothetical protein FH972_006810 [Carpinus fangiana]|uniref:Uncharacterized protein n=1 Tax=Carpinus fangiana TaxID=176857 RepID=A0A5N6QWN7_9ROSI|nr:hypothetical protein FH972_006810 [Carpinus fangiana]
MPLNQYQNFTPITHQSVIQSAHKKILPVGRELHERNGRVLVVDQGLHAMAGTGVPNPAQSIVAAGDDQGTVAIEVDGGDGVGVGGQDLEALGGLDIPDAHGLVEGPGHDDVGLWVEFDAEDVVSVAREGLDERAGLDVPEAEGLVVGGRDEEARVGGEGEVRDALLVALELLERRECGIGVGQAVGAEGLVGGGGGQEAAVR